MLRIVCDGHQDLVNNLAFYEVVKSENSTKEANQVQIPNHHYLNHSHHHSCLKYIIYCNDHGHDNYHKKKMTIIMVEDTMII